MALDPDREVYPNAPLRFVAFEVRFPASPALATQELRRQLFEALRGTFPISQSAPGPVEVQILPGAQPLVQPGGDQLQMIDRTRRRAVTVGTRALLVQTTDYTRYEVFAEWVQLAVHALEATGEAAAMERIGLRYTDEVRIPGVARPSDWRPYVAPTMLGPIDLLGDADANITQALVEFTPRERQRLVMRYGATHGWMVAPDGVLRSKSTESGPYFLIDLDSFWTPPEDELPEFVGHEVMQICDELHSPVRVAFEAAITDKLRNDVLRGSRDEH
jgi:uncharacterized protein (TIGR04255 family)